MRVCVFSDTYLPQVNGVSNTVHRLKESMDTSGIDNMLVVPGDANTQYHDNTLRFDGLNFFLYPELKLVLPRYSEIKEQLDRFKPDLIHLVTEFSLGLAGLKYARDHAVPIVSSYHTNFPDYLKYYNFQFLEEVIWKYLKWFHSFSRINYCPTSVTLLKLQEKGFNNLELWSRGIDSKRFNPGWRDHLIREKYAAHNEPLLLYVGRLAPEKELSVLMNAAGILNSKDIAYKMVIVGDGPSRIALENEKPDNVCFAGYKSGQELQAFYASADLFVFPSSTETYGNVILEAMASGLPVVGAYGGGVIENLIHEYNGLAFSPGNYFNMAECMEKLIIDPQLRQSMSANALHHVSAKDWPAVFNSLFAGYAKVIKENKLINKSA